MPELTWYPNQGLWIWPQDTVPLTHADRYAQLSLYYGYPARPLPCLDLLQLAAKYGMSRIACMSLVFLLISPERLIGPGGRNKLLDRVKQGVTKRSWLTNSALVYEPKKSEGGIAGSQPMSTAVRRSPNKLWRSNSVFNLWDRVKQEVTKRCRLSWLTNSALVYEPKCGESGGGLEAQPILYVYCCTHGAQINSRDLTPYLPTE